MTWVYDGKVIDEDDVFNIVKECYTEDIHESQLNDEEGNKNGTFLREYYYTSFHEDWETKCDEIAIDILSNAHKIDDWGLGIEYRMWD